LIARSLMSFLVKDMRYIHIVNWELTQHYKKRRPPWIRLYAEIIDEFDQDGVPKKFYTLPEEAKLTFIMLLCLSSRYDNNIPYKSDSWLIDHLGIQEISVQPLVDVGFIELTGKHDSKSDSKDDSKSAITRDRDRDRVQKNLRQGKDALGVLNYLNERTKRKYSRMVEISARLKDGGTVEQCKQIIDNQTQDEYFIKNPKFLNPTTLFRKSNWDKYLNNTPQGREAKWTKGGYR